MHIEIVHPQYNTMSYTRHQVDTAWLAYFSPAAALKSVAAHIAALESNQTEEKHTARVYIPALRYWMAWLTNMSPDTPLDVSIRQPMPLPTHEILAEFVAHLRHAKKLKPNSIRSKYLAPVRHWLNALARQHIPGLPEGQRGTAEDCRIAIRSALDFKSALPSSSRRGALYAHGTRLRLTQINDLLTHITEADDLTSRRDLALIYTALTSALRASELARITLASISIGETAPYEIAVLGKRGHTEPVAIDAATVRLIHVWVDAFNAALPGGEDDPRYIGEHTPIWQPLRCGRPESIHDLYDPKTGLSRKSIYGIIKRRSFAALGIEIGTHDLRRTYAARASEAEIPLAAISRQMRHSNLATTSDYIGDREDLSGGLLSNRLQFAIPA